MALMSKTVISVKAIVLGFLTIIFVGFIFSVLAAPFEVLLLGQVGEGPVSIDQILEEVYWPAKIYYWVDVFVSCALGAFVATRTSSSRSHLHWIATVTILLGIVWLVDLSSAHPNIFGPATFSIIALVAGLIGNQLAFRSGQLRPTDD